MTKWEYSSLGDLAEEITVGHVGPMASEYTNSGIPFLRSQNVVPFYIDTEDIKFISESFHDKLKKSKLKPNDVVVVRTGKPGSSAVIPQSLPIANCSDIVIVRCGKKLNPHFTSYYINSVNKSHVQAHIVGAVQQHFNVGSAKQIQIPNIPISEQTAIAEILRSLDDKIDLLHRQNKNLEQLAETLFREWFIEEAEEGWEVGTVLDLFKLQRGFDLPMQNRVEGKYPILTSSGINGNHNDFKIKGPGVTTGRSGVIGNVFYVDEDFWPLNTSLFILEFYRATPLFAYFFLKTLNLENLNSGSAVPTLNRNDVHLLEIALPPHALIMKFQQLIFTKFQKIKVNSQQIGILTRLRDTLLPKLMSGEVKIN